MRNYRPIIIILLFILILFCLRQTLCSQSYTTLTILHSNDLHGYILPSEKTGGAASMATIIKKIRQKEGIVLLLDAGDFAQGTPISNLFYGIPVVEFMNYIKYDALNLGNHEFDWGREALQKLINKANFPVINANIVDEEGHLLKGIKPFIIKRYGRLKVGILGVITPETPYITKKDNVQGLHFLDPEQVISRYIPILKSHGADIIILLSHLGLTRDIQVAKSVSSIDVIIGGHSHTVLEKIMVVNNTLIAQAGCHGEFIGKLTLYLDNNNRIHHYSYQLLAVNPDKYPPCPMASRIIQKYYDQIAPIINERIGETKVNLTRNPSGESNMGNLITDAMRKKAGAEIAFYNSGGIRADIYQGKITWEDIFKVIPFDNLLVTMELTGAQIKEIMEYGLSSKQKVLMQVSGIRIRYNPNRPQGCRIIEITDETGKAIIEDTRTYTVVTNDFLASGGDNFSTFTRGKNLRYGDLVRDAVIEYIKEKGTIKPEIEGRINREMLLPLKVRFPIGQSLFLQPPEAHHWRPSLLLG